MKRISTLFIAFAFCILVVSSAYAQTHKEVVLGSSTDLSQINFPPVTAGPGLILPDSPFYFLDEFKQAVKLTLAMGPRTKSLTHVDIAGERLAELRVMMQRGNMKGIAVALMGISSETEAAVNEMADAKAQGKDVEKLAKEITAHIKITREILKNVSEQSDKDISLQLLATNESLRNTKILAENYLPQQDLENEIADNILERLDEYVLGVKNTSVNVSIASEEYQKMASQAAQNAIEQKQKMLNDAVSSHDKEKVKKAEQELSKEREKQEDTIQTLKKLFQNAQDALQKGSQAITIYSEARNEFQKIRSGNN